MAPPRFVLLLLLLVSDGSCSVCNGVVPPSFVKASDLDLLKLSKGIANKWCEGLNPDADIDVGGRRARLKAAFGGNNFVMDAAKKSNGVEELIGNLFDEMSPGWFVAQAVPLVFAIIVLVGWFFWCWSGCPFCRFCRCCAKPGRTHLFFRVLLVLLLLAFFATTIAGIVYIARGYGQASQGVDRMACTTGRFIENVLDGKSDPPFLGFVPVLRQLDNIVSIFQKDSPFLKDTQDIILNTELLSDSLVVMAGSVGMLAKTMAAAENQYPKLAGGRDSLHVCQLCKVLAGTLGDAHIAIGKSAATVLGEVKSQMMKFLEGDMFCNLETTLLKKITPPLDHFKELVARFINPVLKGPYVDKAQFWVDDVGVWIVSSFPIFVSIYFIVTLVASGCWLFREGRDLDTDSPVYHASAHRIALCVWWSLFIIIVPLLIVGGALQAATGPMSSLCLILDDLNSTTAKDLQGVLQQDFSGDGAILLDMIDYCVYTPYPPPTVRSNKNLLELIPFDPSFGNLTSGAQVPKNMREFITQVVTEPFEMVFASLDEAGKSANANKLSTDPNVVAVRSFLREVDVRSTLLLDKAKAEGAGSGLQSMLKRAGLGDQSLIAVSACEDLGVPQAVKDEYDFARSLEKLPGVESFIDMVTSQYGGVAGPAVAGTGACGKSFTCDPASPDLQACTEAKHFVEGLKKPLMEERVFSCDVWEDAAGNECDILGMTLADKDTGVYAGDCLSGAGKGRILKTRAKKCTLAEFKLYLQDWDRRIDLAMSRVDTASTHAFDKIAKDLRAIVDRNVLAPFNLVTNGLACGFMPVAYQNIINGVCYQGVYGLRLIVTAYLLFGFSCMVLGLVMFCVWRRAVTNYESMGTRQVGDPKQDDSDNEAKSYCDDESYIGTTQTNARPSVARDNDKRTSLIELRAF